MATLGWFCKWAFHISDANNVTPSHRGIHYALPWEWGEAHAENQGRKCPPARRGKMASIIIPTTPHTPTPTPQPQGELAWI